MTESVYISLQNYTNLDTEEEGIERLNMELRKLEASGNRIVSVAPNHTLDIDYETHYIEVPGFPSQIKVPREISLVVTGFIVIVEKK